MNTNENNPNQNLSDNIVTDNTAVSNGAPTPMPATPEVASPTPMPAAPEEVTPTPMQSEVVTPQAPSNPPVMNSEEVTVINTTTSKTSNIGIFIFVILLVLFVINIDRIVDLFDNFIQTGNLTANNNSSDNLTDGYIVVGDASSSKKVKDITFNSFTKSSNVVSFNYTSSTSYSDSASLDIYIGLYDSNKNLLYKELFDTGAKIDKGSVSKYNINNIEAIYTSVYYALVSTNKNTTTDYLTCKYNDGNYEYVNKYTFTNSALVSYEATKKAFTDPTALAEEYNNAADKSYVKFENNILTYTVDLNKITKNVVYSKGISSDYIKSQDSAKGWTCE